MRARESLCAGSRARVELPNGIVENGPAADKTKTPKRKLRGLAGGSDRRRSGDLSIFSRTLYQLSYRAKT